MTSPTQPYPLENVKTLRDENTSVSIDNEPQMEERTDTKDEESAPATAVPALQRWNESRANAFRYFATLYSFIIMGMNDAAYGALIPYLETYYDLNYTIVSLIFLAPFLGYTVAAFLNNSIHMKFGQLGIAVIAPTCKTIAYVITCVHPPYPVLPIIFMLAGFGNGLEDGAWNAWIGNMANANEMLGFLHGAYGLGATISPLIATTMITKGNLQWFTFYYIMACSLFSYLARCFVPFRSHPCQFYSTCSIIFWKNESNETQVGLAAVELLLSVAAFHGATGAKHRAANPITHSSTGQSRTKESFRNPITWICALFLLCYVGVEVSLGGWLVTFMLRVRDGGKFASGMVVTGFWLGLTFGRVILGFATGRIGEKLAITSYLVISMALELCFWLIPVFISSAIFAAWLGFFLGPLFPAAIVAATKLLPQRLHVTAIGFAAAFGGGGAALFPFAVGAIAQAKGVKVLQPIALALLVVILGLWLLLPGGFRKRGLEEAQQAREARRAGMMAEGESTGEESGFGRNVSRLRKRIGIA